MRPSRFAPALMLAVLLATSATVFQGMCASEADAPHAMSRSDTAWNGTVNLTGNLTVDGVLRIAPGTVVRIPPYAEVRINGGLVCDGAQGRPVRIVGAENHTSAGIFIVNGYANCAWLELSNLSVGFEAVYSELALDDCAFTDCGIGVLAVDCAARIVNASFSRCDVGANMVRCVDSYFRGASCGNCLQGLVMNGNISTIGDFHAARLRGIPRTNIWNCTYDLGWTVSSSTFNDCGLGAAGLNIPAMRVSDSSFSSCMKGVHMVAVRGAVDNCTFSENNFDYSFTGRTFDVHGYAYTSADHNWLVYEQLNLTIESADKEPVAGTEVVVSRSGELDLVFVTDGEGRIVNATLLAARMQNGTVQNITAYNVSVDDERFQGVCTLSPREGDAVLTPLDFSDDGSGRTEDVDMGEFALFLLAILVMTVIVILLYAFVMKKS